MRLRFVAVVVLGCLVHSAAGQVKPRRIRVSQGVMENLIIHKVQPACPGGTARIEGQVLLKVVINKAGRVESLEAVTGHPLLIPLAIDAAKQWTYKPFLLNGEAMEVETTIALQFHC